MNGEGVVAVEVPSSGPLRVQQPGERGKDGGGEGVRDGMEANLVEEQGGRPIAHHSPLLSLQRCLLRRLQRPVDILTAQM